MKVGVLNEITRHPVKSMTGEVVTSTHVMPYGLYGDRSHAIKDLSRTDKYLTITQFQKLAKYRAEFTGDESMEKYPPVKVTTPSGEKVMWEGQAWLKEIETQSKRSLSKVQYEPRHVPLGAIEEEHVLIVTDASIEKLKDIWGQEADHRRFRPNLLISLEKKEPFIEDAWFGKTLRIGDEVELQVLRHCERCMIITVDPENAERDPELLKKIVERRNNHFGVYAKVLKTGKIHAGDEVDLVDAE
ncbi:MOSC domain-containing protein [Thalassobacillus hwangdonensis]|uniref:MOSC domain-containing protein n=1 Tax=Thalassobacillus hwangdonensis TaxID=546108 RepID=A0ABW3L5Z8_9BACI